MVNGSRGMAVIYAQNILALDKYFFASCTGSVSK